MKSPKPLQWCFEPVRMTHDSDGNKVIADPGSPGATELLCTLEKGHDGPHIAQGVDDREIFTWERES